MKHLTINIFFFTCLFSSLNICAREIILKNRDATVWSQTQTIRGKLVGFYARQIVVSFNDHSSKITVKTDSTFSVDVTLQAGENKIRVQTPGERLRVVSNLVTLSLGFKPAPLIKPYATFHGKQLTLHGLVIKNPWKGPINYLWSDDLRNPAPSKFEYRNKKNSIVHLPFKNGIYYFNLTVSTSNDTARFQTFIVKNEAEIQAFNMDTEHAGWIDSAVLYEITPSAFVRNGTYDAIKDKLDELKHLGVNTVWLQPIYNTFKKGQGYDVTDYFALRQDCGSYEQLANLIRKAKQLHMRVLFDFVPNHTSLHHPYAVDCIKYGVDSHYYNFYQHEDDGAPYSSLYKKNEDGFINYFWEDLINLNYGNEEVQRWIIEACKYWVEKFDIDGYRFDAIWGVNARMPTFAKKLRLELKSIKPDLLLLAEDKGSAASVYKNGFDAAFDWTADTTWISQWSWQYKYSLRESFTIFDYPDVSKRPEMLRHALFQNGSLENLRLRFIENNDLPRFIKNHDVRCTKMAAALVFSIPGIPMLYNGQEIGFTGHPYSKRSIFEADKSIKSLDTNQLFTYYQKLIELRNNYPALSSKHMESIPISPANKLIALHRWTDSEDLVLILNMDSIPVEATVDVKDCLNIKVRSDKYSFSDILQNNTFVASNFEVKIPMEGYGIRWLLLNKN